MTTIKYPRSFFSADTESAAALALNFGRKALAFSLAYLMIPLGMGDIYAQQAPPPPPDQYNQGQPPDQGPPPQAYNPLSPDQLGQLVAPIALYPDALVAQILAASTYPSQIADADHFVQSNPGVSPQQLGQMADGMNWDPSVKALIAFPSVLANLDKNMDWTSQLGNAYYNQPQDVMSAVQAMRQRAYQAGNLQSNQQIAVQYQPSNIVIAPANPTVVYVPYYNPWVVYGAPVVAYPAYYVAPPPPGYAFVAGLAIGFGVGIAIGAFSHWGWGWHSWGMGWGSHTVVYQRNVYVSRSVTVVNHGYYGHYDRAPGAVAYNRNVAYRAPNVNNYNRSTTINNYNRTVTNNNVNRTNTNNNYNRTNTNNNYNRTNTNNNYNRTNTNNNYNRTNTNNNYNRPTTNNNYNRPTTNNNYNRPTTNNNYNRPTTNNTYNRPTTNNTYHPPANNNSHPAQSHPQQSHPNNSHPSNNHESNSHEKH
jgi:hypothetical protein